LDQVNFALFSACFIKEPATYEEAINCERKEEQIRQSTNNQKKWQKEVYDEKDIPIQNEKKWDFSCKTCDM
jgi:hypothetical protein